MANLKNVVYLTQEQYNTLSTTGSITVRGVTYNYDSDNLYLTPKTADEVTELKKEDTNYLSKVSVDASDKISIISDDSPSGYSGQITNSTRVEIAPHTALYDTFNWFGLNEYNRSVFSLRDGNIEASTNISSFNDVHDSCKLGLYSRGTGDAPYVDDVYAVLGCYGDATANIKSPNYGFYADNTKVGYYENGVFKNFSSGGGSTVSGTHDGTNWTTITINGTQKAIPSGGGGGGGSANVVKLPGSAMTYVLLEFGGTSYPSYYWEIPSSVPITSGLVAVVGYSEVAWEVPGMYAATIADTAGYVGADACAKLKPFIDWQGQVIPGKYTVIMPFTEVAPFPASGVCTLIW